MIAVIIMIDMGRVIVLMLFGMLFIGFVLGNDHREYKLNRREYAQVRIIAIKARIKMRMLKLLEYRNSMIMSFE